MLVPEALRYQTYKTCTLAPVSYTHLDVYKRQGIATNIGVALFDDEGNLVPINRPPANWKRLYSGSTSLHFIAKYRATGRRVTGGIANADVYKRQALD